ncbi:MAG: metal-sulfur cluster assembly factor [Patescibacteria group bacterium]
MPIHPIPSDQRTESYWTLLNNVIDPEIGFGIVDLGLIYGVAIEEGVATVTMTLTSMGCPMASEIMRRVQAEMMRYPDIHTVTIDLVWSPLWTPDRVDPSVRALLYS